MLGPLATTVVGIFRNYQFTTLYEQRNYACKLVCYLHLARSTLSFTCYVFCLITLHYLFKRQRKLSTYLFPCTATVSLIAWTKKTKPTVLQRHTFTVRAGIRFLYQYAKYLMGFRIAKTSQTNVQATFLKIAPFHPDLNLLPRCH